jgi:hypothetical protein
MLNFAEQTGSGAVILVWSFLLADLAQQFIYFNVCSIWETEKLILLSLDDMFMNQFLCSLSASLFKSSLFGSCHVLLLAHRCMLLALFSSFFIFYCWIFTLKPCLSLKGSKMVYFSWLVIHFHMISSIQLQISQHICHSNRSHMNFHCLTVITCPFFMGNNHQLHIWSISNLCFNSC